MLILSGKFYPSIKTLVMVTMYTNFKDNIFNEHFKTPSNSVL